MPSTHPHAWELHFSCRAHTGAPNLRAMYRAAVRPDTYCGEQSHRWQQHTQPFLTVAIHTMNTSNTHKQEDSLNNTCVVLPPALSLISSHSDLTLHAQPSHLSHSPRGPAVQGLQQCTNNPNNINNKSSCNLRCQYRAQKLDRSTKRQKQHSGSNCHSAAGPASGQSSSQSCKIP